ncbi:MAG: beta-N-acetylhexosaminidase [Oscillospiraceae bacterium]|nr:beta-N-acetylhexosaminidase [Oscillospiraceae bacterium]
MHIAKAIQSGCDTLHTEETRGIASVGPLIDCSRGAVMTVSAVCRYIDSIAAMGMNLLILYTEVTFTVPEYPYFGYLQGRYTPTELRRIDDYAASMGVEFVPNIQTLAHLGQFLQWRQSEHLKDTQYCLLIDDEETYKFIEAEIRAIRACVRTRRLHIGMDEAHGVGLGNYYDKHGPVDRFDMLLRHLVRVVGICEKYDFHPMMWSDMFFRLGSNTGDYYDPNAVIPQSVVDGIPDVDLVYWDYHSTDEGFLNKMIAQHRRMCGDAVFAGAIHAHNGFLPQVDRTLASTVPALRAASACGIQTAIPTLWGDDGNETDYFLAIPLLPLYSEACWRDAEFNEERTLPRSPGSPTNPQIWRGGSTDSRDLLPRTGVDGALEQGCFISGLPREALDAFALFHAGADDDRTSKGLIYCDLLYPLLPGDPNLSAKAENCEKALALLSEHQDLPQCRYARALFDIALLKARLIPAIRSAYKSGDKAALRKIAEDDIPRLTELYAVLQTEHRAQWEKSYKRNGWETFALRYGATVGRAQDVAYALTRYANGELDTLAELDEEPLEASRRGGMQWYCIYSSPRL